MNETKVPYKKIIALDVETAWCSKTGYTLSKMTTEEYVRDSRFKAWGLCWHEVGEAGGAVWVRGDNIQEWVNGIDWSSTAVLAHNAQFDIAILSWRYGAKPCFIFDSLSMARALRGVEVGNSLAKLAEAFALPAKGKAVQSTDGMLDTISFGVELLLAEYCKHDVFLCEQIFCKMLVGYDPATDSMRGLYPQKELELIDLTLKMFTQPLLELDKEILKVAITQEKDTREALLKKLDVEEEDLASNAKFAVLLEQLGVFPPTKISKVTNKRALALAKTDAMFQAMLNGDNEDVAQLCEARLMVKSTGERTRAQRFFEIAERGKLPVPLSYYGASTGRWTASKGSAINMQNLKRKSFLRDAILAPEEHQLVVGDLSQIEPRVLAWLSGYEELLKVFRAGGDPYAQFGAQMFGIPGMTKESHGALRQSAKSALLGAGYQLGWANFSGQLLTGFLGAPPTLYDKTFAKQLGVSAQMVKNFVSYDPFVERMKEIPHICTDQELLIHCVASKSIIDKYRAAAAPVVAFWEMCEALIERSLFGGEEYTHKCLVFRKEEIVLPSGMSIKYPNLRRQRTEKGQQWVYGEEAGITTLYGGKITNNVTQGVARCVMTDGILRVQKRYPVAGTVHDECICVVPDDEVEFAKTWVLAEMTREPDYLPGIPLAADGGAHRRYGKAKG